MAFSDDMKHKADELHLQEKAAQAAEALKKAAEQARVKAGDLAHEHQDKIDSAIGKAAKTVNEKTGGKHADKVTKAAEAARKGAHKLADQRSTDSRLHDQTHDPKDPVTPDHPVHESRLHDVTSASDAAAPPAPGPSTPPAQGPGTTGYPTAE